MKNNFGGVLVDTSVFVNYLRGNSDDTLAILMLNNSVILSSVVCFEILAGVKRSEIKLVNQLLQGLKLLLEFSPTKEVEKLLFRLCSNPESMPLQGTMMLTLGSGRAYAVPRLSFFT